VVKAKRLVIFSILKRKLTAPLKYQGEKNSQKMKPEMEK
jgi:hypothetical protein